MASMERYFPPVPLWRFWCSWCGETRVHHDPDAEIPCIRCATEFTELFGYTPVTTMICLKPDEEPGPPASATRSFRFTDPEGREVGRTGRRSRRGARQDPAEDLHDLA
jgi:hypothetical protein